MQSTTRLGSFAAALLLSSATLAHGPASDADADSPLREIEFPDTAGHMTLVVDLHTHSVFSDGHVWPRIRVSEALRDGLDAMAITEHLEWQPHLADIPHADRNRSFEEAVASQPEGSELILIAGSEITRRAPHGHMNAVFIQDANALIRRGTPAQPFDVIDYYLQSAAWDAGEVLSAAGEQGAFVFWNHSWSDFPNRMTAITDFHKQAVADGKLHGIEIANGDTYSPESFQIALDHGLTPIGVSDVHNLIDWDYEPHNGGHRPVNLVFTKERTSAAIRRALFDGRTVVWYQNLLIGRERDLLPLLEASLRLTSASYRGEGSTLELIFENDSDATFELENLNQYTSQGGQLFGVAPHAEQRIVLRTPERSETVELQFRIRNALTAPRTHPTMKFSIRPQS